MNAFLLCCFWGAMTIGFVLFVLWIVACALDEGHDDYEHRR